MFSNLFGEQESRLDESVLSGLIAVVVESSAVDVEPFLELRQYATSRSVPRFLHARQPLDAGRREIAPPSFDLVERHQHLFDQSKGEIIYSLGEPLQPIKRKARMYIR